MTVSGFGFSKKVKSFPSHTAHKNAEMLICFFSCQPDTSLNCETTDTGLVHYTVYSQPLASIECTATDRDSQAALASRHGLL